MFKVKTLALFLLLICLLISNTSSFDVNNNMIDSNSNLFAVPVKLKHGQELSISNMSRKHDPDMDNYLKITIESSTDVIAKLMKVSSSKSEDTCIRVIYLKGNSHGLINNIPEGIYYLKVAYGEEPIEINSDGNIAYSFRKLQLCQKTEDLMKYEKIIEIKSDGINTQFTCFEVRLRIISSINKNDLDTKEISESEFLK